MELVFQLPLEHREACEEGKRAFHSGHFQEAEQYARTALSLVEKLHPHGEEIDRVDNLRAPTLLAVALAEQGDSSQLGQWQELLTQRYSVSPCHCSNAYCADALAQKYLKENRREKAISSYLQLLDKIQHKTLNIPTYDTPVALEHYAYLLAQEKNFPEASKIQELAHKFRQQLKQMSVKDPNWQSAIAPL